MSHIYIQEPATSGKVLLKTTIGEIDIELWAKECPKACRNFVQLCMEGYYDNLVFHRIVKGFIAQGGDPQGDGTGGLSIYGEPFKDEFHSRLRYTRRGLVGMANSGPNDNGSQFFFTLGETPELQNQNTLFGKVTGDTIYNMLKFEDIVVDHNERPFYPPKILGTEILNNPFDDIIPRQSEKPESKEKKKKNEKGVKNFGLLSFGEEAEVDEIQTIRYAKKNAGKAKSMHDVIDDPKLSKDAIRVECDNDDAVEGDHTVAEEKDDSDTKESKQRIKDKLNKKSLLIDVKEDTDDDDNHSLDELDINNTKRRQAEKKRTLKHIRNEINKLRRDYQTTKDVEKRAFNENLVKIEKEQIRQEKREASIAQNKYLKEFYKDRQDYANYKSKLPKNGKEREDHTMELLKGFRAKLDAVKEEHTVDTSDTNKKINDSLSVIGEQNEEEEADIQSGKWMAHTLSSKDETPILAKDASTKGDDWYDVYDPRNPLNKRKRGEDAPSSTKRKTH